MLCYLDRTFCSSDCIKRRCYRYFGPDQRAGAEKWWGGPDAPVAFSDFSNECGDYKPPKVVDVTADT